MDELLCAIAVGERLGPPDDLIYHFKVVRLEQPPLNKYNNMEAGSVSDDDVDWTSLGGLKTVKHRFIKAYQWPCLLYTSPSPRDA